MKSEQIPVASVQNKYTWLILWLITALITSILFFGQLRVGLPMVSDISYLLPATQSSVEQTIIAQQNDSFRRRYLLLISSSDATLTGQVHTELAQVAPNFGFNSAINQNMPAGYSALLEQYPFAFLSGADKRALAEGNADFLAQSALNYWLGFNTPAFLSPSQDPLGLVGKFFQSQSSRLNGQAEGILTPVALQNQFQTLWQQIIPLSHATTDNTLDAQQLAFEQLQQLIKQVQTKFPGAHVSATGLAVHAVNSAQQTQREIFIISTLATLAIVLLSLTVYRRLLPLLAAFGTIVFGSWVGIVGCIAVFNQIHILAIAFGTSLMGVVVDYSFHYFSVQRRISVHPGDKQRIIRIIRPGITLSLITALAGYFGLWQTGMLVLQQIALLCVVGILAACLTIFALYPYLPAIDLPPRHLPIERLLTFIANQWQKVPTRFIYVLFTALMLLTGFVLLQTHINPSLAALYTPPAGLKETEKNIAQIYKEFVPNQYLAVIAPSPELLIHRLYQLQPDLNGLMAQGAIQTYNDLSQWVPNPDTIQADAHLYTALMQQPSMQALLTQFEVNPENITPPGSAPLSMDWINQLPEAIKNSLFVPLADGQVAGLIRFTGIKDSASLQNAIQKSEPLVKHTHYIDTVKSITEGLSTQTRRASYGLGLAFGLALGILFAFYRNTTALALIAVPLASCAITLCLIIGLGTLSLFHLLALFLALGLGVDYAILFSHSGKFPDGVSAEIVSLAAVGNALSFGLLSVTSLPMLAAFGVATGVCLVCNFIFAPLVVRWVK